MLTTILLVAGIIPAAAAPPITTYDLTYALRFNAKEPQQVAAAWDQAHAVAALQGLVNRKEPRLYLRFVEWAGRNVDDYWLRQMQQPGGWLADRPVEKIDGIAELVTTFRGAIKGVVLYDPKVPATSNLASTVAGVEELLPVRYDPAPDTLYTQLVASGPRLPIVKRLLKEDGTALFTGKGTIPGTKLPSTRSAKCDAYLWLKVHYIDTGKVDATYAGYYIDTVWLSKPGMSQPNHHTLTNHDFFVAHKAFFFDLNCWADEAPVDDPQQPLGTDLKTLQALLQSAYEHGGRERMVHIGGFTPWAFKYTDYPGAGGKHGGVPTEWEFVRLASAYNAYVDADALANGALANASFFQHFPLKERYKQPWVTRKRLQDRGLLDADGQVRLDDRDFIIFYVGDYDSAAWIYQFMPSLWDHPARGRLPLMWCITPLAERRIPVILDRLRRTASANDYFAVADNGAGYLNPGMLQEPREFSNLPSGLDAWARHCEPMYRRWDLSITGFVIDGYAPGLNKDGLDCYARFSPNGIVPQKIPVSLLHGNMPVIRADYDIDGDPQRAAETILARVKLRRLPFHWFRAILKGPDWYEQVYAKVHAANPKIELLDAPSFFEVYRQYLKTHPEAAEGKVPLKK